MRPRLVVALALLLWPQLASAQSYDPTWPTFGVADALVTAGFGVVALAAEIVGGPRHPRWEREVLLDLPMRRAIGSTRAQGEHRAALVSDLTVTTLMVAPFVDAAAVGWGAHRDEKLATNFGLFALEGFAITFGVTGLTKVLVGRARPRVAACFEDPAVPCEERAHVSFFSGHSSVAFTGAGLLCAFGTVTEFHGGSWKGQIPCVSGLIVAAATATLRLVANKHHLSDVIVGTIAGLASGWLLPAIRLPR